MTEDDPGVLRRVYRWLLFRDLDDIYENIASMEQEPARDERMLDVGSGLGFQALRFQKQGYDVYGIDIEDRLPRFAERAEEAGMEYRAVRGDAQELPFRDDAFDVTHCRHLIEHVPDDTGTLGEIRRVLRDDGRVILTVPNVRNLYTSVRKLLDVSNPYTDRTHLREYTEEEIRELVEEEGFRIREFGRSGFFLPFGQKVIFLLDHYIPVSKMLEKLTPLFPSRCAEFNLELEVSG